MKSIRVDYCGSRFVSNLKLLCEGTVSNSQYRKRGKETGSSIIFNFNCGDGRRNTCLFCAAGTRRRGRSPNFSILITKKFLVNEGVLYYLILIAETAVACLRSGTEEGVRSGNRIPTIF